MADTVITPGGPPTSSIVSADQRTILGNGSSADPLRVAAAVVGGTVLSPWAGGSPFEPGGGNDLGPFPDATAPWFLPVPVGVGQILRSPLRFLVFGNGTVDFAFFLVVARYSGAGSIDILAQGERFNVPASWSPYLAEFDDYQVQNDEAIVLHLVGGAGFRPGMIGPVLAT